MEQEPFARSTTLSRKSKLFFGIFSLGVVLAGTVLFALNVTAPKTVKVNTPIAGHAVLTANTPYQKLTPGTSWQIQFNSPIDEKVLDKTSNPKKMYDIDMENTSANIISRLKNKGITVVCYMEVGAWENYRQDAKSFPANVKGKSLDPPFQNERYLDIRSKVVKDLIVKRMDRAKAKGCQGIDPDIDDAYFQDFTGNYNKKSSFTGFSISYADQLSYNRYMANAAHSRGMSYGLKNGADARYVKDMLPYADWVLNEQCYQYKECDVYKPFIAANKAVFQIEYTSPVAKFCPALNKLNFDSIKKSVALSATPRVACRND
jgi:hypothetical protein